MKQDVSGFYLLQDGTHALPNDVSEGKDGVLRNKNGLAVAMDGNGKPQTIGGDAIANKNVDAANAGKPEVNKADDVKAAEPEAKPDPVTPLIPNPVI